MIKKQDRIKTNLKDFLAYRPDVRKHMLNKEVKANEKEKSSSEDKK